VEAVLLDAFGTLLHLDDPVPRLGALLADAGHPHPADALDGTAPPPERLSRILL